MTKEQQRAHISITHNGKQIEVLVDDCEFESISEDMFGRDLLVVTYEGLRYEAYPFMRWT